MMIQNPDKQIVENPKNEKVDEDIKKNVEALKQRKFVPDGNNVYELSDETFRELFGDSDFFSKTLTSTPEPQQSTGEGFRNEEFEFKKYLINPALPVPFLTKDLQLSYLSPYEVGTLADLLNFAEELHSIGFPRTVQYIVSRVYYFLALKVSVNGFGRKELSTIRQETKSEEVVAPSSRGLFGGLKRD